MSRTFIEISERRPSFHSGGRASLRERYAHKHSDLADLPQRERFNPRIKDGFRNEKIRGTTLYKHVDRFLDSHTGEKADSVYAIFVASFLPGLGAKWISEARRIYKDRIIHDDPAASAACVSVKFPLFLVDSEGILRRYEPPKPVKPPRVSSSLVPVPRSRWEQSSCPELWRRLGSVWYRFTTIPALHSFVHPNVSILEKEAKENQRDVPSPFEISGYNPDYRNTAWSKASTCGKKEIRAIREVAARQGITLPE